MEMERKDLNTLFGLKEVEEKYKKDKENFIALGYKIFYEIMLDIKKPGFSISESEIERHAISVYNENLTDENLSILDKIQILRNRFLFIIIKKSMVAVIRSDRDLQNYIGIYQPHILRNDFKIIYLVDKNLSNINFLVVFFYAVENLKHKNFKDFVKSLNVYFEEAGIQVHDNIDETIRMINRMQKKDIAVALKNLLSVL
jgi:cysteinyl-tRNA synthetase